MVSLSSGELTVRYFKLGDRVAHAIGLVRDDAFVPILESIEGSELEPWPVSPPMQEMVEESFTPDASPVLLGVGLSGNGHWSTAVEAKDGPLLKFDIACKNSKSSSSLGSEYRIATKYAWKPSEVSSQKITLMLDSKIILAKIELVASIGQLNFSSSEDRIRISPISDPGTILTHRWCYELSLVSIG